MEIGYASYRHPHTGATASIALHKRYGHRYQVTIQHARTIEHEQAWSVQEAHHIAAQHDKHFRQEHLQRIT